MWPNRGGTGGGGGGGDAKVLTKRWTSGKE